MWVSQVNMKTNINIALSLTAVVYENSKSCPLYFCLIAHHWWMIPRRTKLEYLIVSCLCQL